MPSILQKGQKRSEDGFAFGRKMFESSSKGLAKAQAVPANIAQMQPPRLGTAPNNFMGRPMTAELLSDNMTEPQGSPAGGRPQTTGFGP